MQPKLQTGIFVTIVAFASSSCGGTTTSGDGGDTASDLLDDALDAADDSDDTGGEDTLAEDEADEDWLPACAVDGREPHERGWIASGTSLEAVDLPGCDEHRWSFAAPTGSAVRLDLLSRGMGTVELAVAWPDDLSWSGSLATVQALEGQPASHLDLDVPRSGEFVVLVRTVDPVVEGDYDLGLSCTAGCDLETTRYPVVLVHGWTGWESIGSYTYFYDVPETLTERGYPVFVASLDPYNSVEVRSGQLAEQIDGFLAEGRARSVDIVAHSQGGLDSRRAISTLGYGDRVSALVTVATPHQGTPIADIALGYLPGPAEDALYFLLELLGATAVGSESDARASFESLTTSFVQDEFNPANPDDPRVSYISWTGITCPVGLLCGDTCDIEIQWSYDIIYLMAGDNDGMVPVSSAPWGEYRGEVPADHFDEIGQLLGVTGPNFDHREFYLGLARDLASSGH